MGRKIRSVPLVRAEKKDLTLVVQVDPLKVSQGHRVMPRGGVHRTNRRPSRARSKGQWRRQLEHEGGGCRGRYRIGPLV